MNCKIIGYEFKALEVVLAPNEDFYGEAGSMVYMEEGIERELDVVRIRKSFARYFSGESIFIVHYKNTSLSDKKLLISSGLLGLHPIKITGGNPILLRCGSYVASTKKVSIGVRVTGFGLKSGMSFQKVEGDATIFVETAGTPLEIDLKDGEVIEVDENHILALLNFNGNGITSKWQFRNLFHGEGLSTNSIKGPRKVILSPSPLPNVKDPVQKYTGCLITILIYAGIIGLMFLLNL